MKSIRSKEEDTHEICAYIWQHRGFAQMLDSAGEGELRMIIGRKYLAFALVALVLLGALVGCIDPNIENLTDEAGSFSNIEGSKSLTDRLKLAWSPINLSDEYYTQVTRGFEDYCDEMEYVSLVANPKNNSEEQFSEFENWIAMGVDGIVASPVDAQRLSEAVRSAKEAGIVVAGFYNEIPQANLNFVLDEYACGVIIGENAARWIDEKMTGAANVFILGNDAQMGMHLRRQGIDSVLKGIDSVRVVSRINAATPDEAEKAALEVLDMYPYINVVICVSDEYAFAVLDATDDLSINNENYYIGGAGYTSKMIVQMNEAGNFVRSTVNFVPYQAGRKIAQLLAEAVVNDSFGKTEYMKIGSYWQNLLGWE